MKNTFKYLFIFACSLATVASCATFEEQEDAPVAEPKVKMTFAAEIEGNDDADTKTVLGGQMGDQYRKVLWEPGDSVGITNSLWYRYMDPFINTEEGISEVATFEGSTEWGESYYLFYPYNESLYCRDNNRIDFKLPSSQAYKNQSFDTGLMPMVAKGNRGETFQFHSLCGVLAINLTGSETVKSVSFSGRDALGNQIPVAGSFYVMMDYETYPEMFLRQDDPATNTSITTITLDCGEGVQINPSEPIPFYIVLPVGTYNEFSVVVATTDGKLMLKESKKPLTIKRANVTKTSALAYVADVAVDLSEIGHSNCYIVPEPGLYSFDVNVIGNGEFGLVENAKFHTSNTSIEPASAELLWEDRTGVISGLVFDGEKVSFMSTGVEGNALIAVKDGNNQILWSWHIWSTDQPQEHVYVNDRGTFTMLDRNIGATRNDRGTGEDYWESLGMRYQWGRKDPFGRTATSKVDLYDRISAQLSIAETIQYPKSFVRANNPWTSEWNKNFWSTDQKTIYDPCPVGYRVPIMDVWRGFTVDGENADRRSKFNVSGSFDRGWNFIYDGTNTAWYPVSHYISYWGDFNETEQEAFYWTSINESSWGSYYFRFYYEIYSDNPDFNCSVSFDAQDEVSYGMAVRCMKDEGHVDISYPTVKITNIKDISAAGASIVANVSDEGIASVTERGIVWGTSKDISLDNAEKMIAESAGAGEYILTLDGLAHSTTYYVRAYAINERGISYSEAKSFYTPYDGDAVNLSRGGTANCYIVPPVYSDYVFNASVKGNSDESVGDIASVEVLWETCNTSTAIEKGDVIESVSLEGNNVFFRLPFDPKPGNALIAVKDAIGTILWSWHIWVVDFDPEETQQKYISGAIMMDRNLGALSVKPADNNYDYGAYGLFYQWGRKDPFAGPGEYGNGWTHAYTAPVDAIVYDYYELSVDNIEHTVKNPNVVYDDARWNNATDLWGYEKTKYDPCPLGWRVPDYEAWYGLEVRNGDNGRTIFIDEPYSIPAAYIPKAGRTDGNAHIDGLEGEAYIWLTRYAEYMDISESHIYSNSWGGVDHLRSVRCMKDIGTSKPGSGDDVIVDDEYEW